MTWPVCTLPIEYCSFTTRPEKCKTWLRDNHPDLFASRYPAEADNVERLATDVEQMDLQGEQDDGAGEKKHQSRGGKALPKDEAKRLEKEEQKRKKAKVIIKMVERNKRKSVTHIRGLELFGLDLKKVAKTCANKYACGCSVVRNPAGYDEVVIQGDFVDDLLDFIPEEFREVPESQIEVVQK